MYSKYLWSKCRSFCTHRTMQDMGFLGEAVILHDGIISYCHFMVYDSFSLPVSTTGLLLSPTVQTFFFKLKKSEAIDKKILHQKPIRTRLYTLCQ